MRVTWTKTSDFATHFRIYRDGVLIAAVPASKTTYDDKTIKDGVTHNYCVRSYNNIYNMESKETPSNLFSCDIGRGFPIHPKASDGIYSNRVKISWDNLNSVASEIKIYRDDDELGTVSSNARSFYDYDAIPGKIHRYGIAAINSSGVEFTPVEVYGYIAPDGRIEGKVTTPTLAGIKDVDVSIVPTSDTTRSALSFDGNDDYVDAGGEQVLSPIGKMTLEFWVKKNIRTGAGFICDKWNVSNENGYRVWIMDTTLFVKIANTVSRFGCITGRWQHIAITVDGTAIKYYIDGMLKYTDTYGWILNASNRPLIIGNIGTNKTVGLDGNLDDFRVWDYVRTGEEIRRDMNRRLSGNETGLLGYWPFDKTSSTPNVTGDYAVGKGNHGYIHGPVFTSDIPDVKPRALTDVSGYYAIRGIYYGSVEQFAVMPFKERHGFRPDTLKRTLDLPNPSALNVNFTDTTAFSVEGYVKFPSLPGQLDSCGVSGVQILINGKYGGVKTDGSGRFLLSVPEAGAYTFTPRFSNHRFEPPSITLNIDDHVVAPNALQFADTTTHLLSVRARGGSRDCDVPVGKADVTIDAMGTDPTNVSPCYSFTSTTNTDGNLYLRLPAQRYHLNVKYLSTRIPIGPGKEQSRMWDMTEDSLVAGIIPDTTSMQGSDTLRVSVEDTLYFNYHPKPIVTINQFWESCSDLKVLEQGVDYRVKIDVQEIIPHRDGAQYDVTCDLDTGYVLIYDEIKDGFTGPDTLVVSQGKVFLDFDNYIDYYMFTAGEPNIYEDNANPSHSYRKKFQVAAKSHDQPLVWSEEIWAVVKGHKARTQTFFTKTPELPFFILRDPPGDQSFSFLEKGDEASYTYGMQFEKSGGLNLFGSVKVGGGVAYPFIGTIGIYYQIKGSLDMGVVSSSQNTVTTTFTATERFSTETQIPGVTDPLPGGGDVVVGASLNMTYALTDVVDVDENCKITRDVSIVWGTEGFNTTYIYTIEHIKRTLIPQLDSLKQITLRNNDAQSAKDSAKIFQHYIDLWTQVVEQNEELKEKATFIRNVSFSAGAQYTSSETSTKVETISHDFTAYIDLSVAQAIGAKVGDLNQVEGGYEVHFKFQSTTSESQTTTSSRTIGFTLNDDDPGDFFSVDIKRDSKYGTPVFDLVAGTSSCPWEPGSQSRDGAFFGDVPHPQPKLALDKYDATEILPDEKATFILTMTNTSESDEVRYYDLLVSQLSNPDGAIIRVGGVVIEKSLRYMLPPGVGYKATLTVERGPIAYDYENLQVILRSECDTIVSDIVHFNVHFLSPCSGVTLVEPGNNWLVNQTNNNVLHIVLTDLEKDKIGEDLELQYRKIGTQKWKLGMIIPLNDIVDQKFKFFETDWTIPPNIMDGAYELRVKIQCTSVLGAGITYSNIATGIINRTALQVFGVPEPADGILNFGDEISVMFSDEVDCGQIATADISLMFADDSTFISRDSIMVDCMGNKIILKPVVPLRRMQGRYLVARIDRLFNDNGNPLLAPVEWTFKVNQNRLVWETSNTVATTYQGSQINVTGKLKNVGGRMETFALSPTQSWLSPLTTSGTVPPAGDQTITFLVSDKLNPGEYADTVYARTADGDEPFYITVRVLHTPPDWTVDNSKYRYTMNFTTQFIIDSAYSNDAADMVAAFIGNECRGVANMQYIPSLDVYRAFLTVYSEDRGSETVRFRVWDASTGKVYSMQETYTYARNTSFGTIALPVVLHPDGVEQTIPLDRSWTWFSINKQAADMSPNAVLANTDAVRNDLLKSQTKYCQYSPGSGWVGSLDTMRIGEAYKIKLSSPSQVSYIGSQVPVTTPITYSAGWNWIGYLPNSILDINTALGSMIPSANDWIKSRDAFAQYNASGGWQGSMGTMDPGFGYMLNAASGGTLTYPDVGNLWPGRRSRVISATSFAKAASTPAWSVDPSAYEHTMNLTGVLYVDGALANDSANIIGAFVGRECRGIITPIDFQSNAMYFMTLYSNGGNEIITLKAYIASMDTVVEISEKMLFSPDVVLGSPDMPFALHANTVLSGIEDGNGTPTAFALQQNFPNPFGMTSLSATDATTISYSLPRPEFVTLKVYDVLGKEIAVLVNEFKPEGRYRVQFDASALPGGVYTYRIKAGTYRATRTMVFLK